MKNVFTIFFGLFIVYSLSAQQTEQVSRDAEPVDGIEELALVYYKIDFSRQQRALLEDLRLELIFVVDTTGAATLREVNGIQDAGIIDSLKSQHPLPVFYPAMSRG